MKVTVTSVRVSVAVIVRATQRFPTADTLTESNSFLDLAGHGAFTLTLTLTLILFQNPQPLHRDHMVNERIIGHGIMVSLFTLLVLERGHGHGHGHGVFILLQNISTNHVNPG